MKVKICPKSWKDKNGKYVYPRGAFTIPEKCKHKSTIGKLGATEICLDCGAFRWLPSGMWQYPTYWKRLHEANQ